MANEYDQVKGRRNPLHSLKMNDLVPTKVFLTKGVGRHKYQLKSFEQALRKAGVAQLNLVTVSSILPPKCKIISSEKGINMLMPGAISFCVMARSDTNEHGRLVASSVGVALPKDEDSWGYLSEVHGHGMNSQKTWQLVCSEQHLGWNSILMWPGPKKNRHTNPAGCSVNNYGFTGLLPKSNFLIP